MFSSGVTSGPIFTPPSSKPFAQSRYGCFGFRLIAVRLTHCIHDLPEFHRWRWKALLCPVSERMSNSTSTPVPCRDVLGGIIYAYWQAVALPRMDISISMGCRVGRTHDSEGS